MHHAFFLDRDGTINVDHDFVHTPDEWDFCDGAVEAIRWMNEHRLKVIVVTNQSGIVRGRYSLAHVEELHHWVDEQLEAKGAYVDGWYVAPYHPEFDEASSSFDAEDRKPGIGMFTKAIQRFDIDVTHSFMAGDKLTDLMPAVELGITPFFIRSRHEPNQDKTWLQRHNVPICNNLSEVVSYIERHALLPTS